MTKRTYNEAFVFTDLHGCDKALQKIIKEIQPNQLVVFLGDAIDRGPSNYNTVKRLMWLKGMLKDRFVYLRGNHEQMFIEALTQESSVGVFLDNGGRVTMYDMWITLPHNKRGDFQSFLTDIFYSGEEGFLFFKKQFKDMHDYLMGGEIYRKWDSVLFTHAGFDSDFSVDEWEKKTDYLDFMWIRNHYTKENKTGLVNVFGHTPTSLIDKEKCSLGQPYISKGYIGLDGGGVFGGRHNVVVLNPLGEIVSQFYVDGEK